MKEKYKALIALFATVILFSFHVIIVRMEVATVPSMYLFFLRMLIASISFLPFFIKSRVFRKPRFRALLAVSLLSSVNLTFFMWGIKYTTASASQMIYAAQPILTVFAVYYFLRQKYSPLTVFGA